MLVSAKIIMICGSGSGSPVVRDPSGDLQRVESIIDKDRAARLLAADLAADAFLMLTGVVAVHLD
ncbi:hypothetical protein ACO2RV_21570 [Ancylobacter sp. VNQ12]|uniref:hypothetical protein n=1 Tax=Ancylobacter sp. VNQ12 TaxID=3400920 RepID=UPI003C0E82ED